MEEIDSNILSASRLKCESGAESAEIFAFTAFKQFPQSPAAFSISITTTPVRLARSFICSAKIESPLPAFPDFPTSIDIFRLIRFALSAIAAISPASLPSDPTDSIAESADSSADCTACDCADIIFEKSPATTFLRQSLREFRDQF